MFYDRLNALCKSRGLKITDFSGTILKVSNATPTNWKKGISPKSSIVVLAAKYFDVSTDYLLEMTDDPTPSNENLELEQQEVDLIKELRKAPALIRENVYKMAAAVLTSPPIHAIPANVRPFLPPKDEPVNHATPRAKPTKPKRYMKRVEGNAAAGIPITAVPEDDLHISVPAKYLDDRYFIVRAVGDSMIGANIDSGDYCVFDRDAYRDEGRIMLVQVDALDQPEDTIKRVYFDGAQIELRSANLAYDPMFFPADEVQITGVLVDVLAPDD
ncbi:MAG: S24 family peptidase [Clostridia bacterium]